MKKIILVFMFIFLTLPTYTLAGTIDYSFIYGKEVTYVGNYQEGLMVVSDKDLFGYVDKSGNTVIEQKYEYAFYFNDGLAVVAKGPNQWGYINKDGIEVVPCIYEVAFDYSEGLCAVKKNGAYGYVDGSGKEIIPFIYEWAGPFSDGLAPVVMNGQQYFISHSGDIAIDKPLLNGEILGSGYEQGDIVYWAFDNYFYEGLTPTTITLAEKNNTSAHDRLVFIDTTGKISLEAKPYDSISLDIYFKSGLAIVLNEAGFGYIDKTGNEFIPCQYENARDFYEGYAAVMLNGKWGYIDTTGEVKIPFIYDDAYDFSEGLACVSTGGKTGYIDKNNNFVIEPVFEFALDFRDGLTWCVKDGVYGVIKNPLVRVFVNGGIVVFDQNPIIYDDRLLVPMRAIFNSLGADVAWDGENESITVTENGSEIILKIGENTMYKNSQPIELEVSPIISGGRTMVPLRAVSEALNTEVLWNGAEKRVDISNPG